MRNSERLRQEYKKILSDYLQEKNEQMLYRAEQLSRQMIEQKISPDEALNIHIQALRDLFGYLPAQWLDSFDLLLEVMVGYGMAYREHQSLRSKQIQLESEIDIAASMQETLLRGEIPQTETLEIGAVSRPAKKMNGDYYHFVRDENDTVGVAIADIIGKGIPAALSMSMIKYAMDSYPEQRMQPGAILENLNRVVEQNVDPGMFITMLYGIYDPRVHRFYYAGAGHEPGFFYRAEQDLFEEMPLKGLVLGVDKNTTYEEFETAVAPGDMIILLSDGVTECRTKKGFIERSEITDRIRKHAHLSAQMIVENVYKELEELQDFELRDDFTLIILRRKV